MRPHLYSVTLRHDHGVIRIRMAASSKAAAGSIICAFENCPQSAILAVHDHGPVDYDLPVPA